MRRVGDRQFLHAWQVIRADTQPGPEATTWRIGDVLCRRYRHSLMTPDHSIIAEVYHVERPTARSGWHLMITAETWWDSNRTVLRTQIWASHVGGSKDNAMAWVLGEAAARDRPLPAS